MRPVKTELTSVEYTHSDPNIRNIPCEIHVAQPTSPADPPMQVAVMNCWEFESDEEIALLVGEDNVETFKEMFEGKDALIKVSMLTPHPLPPIDMQVVAEKKLDEEHQEPKDDTSEFRNGGGKKKTKPARGLWLPGSDGPVSQ